MTCSWPTYPLTEAFTIYRPKAIDLAAIVAEGRYPVISEAGEIGRADQYNHGPDEIIMVSRGPECGAIRVTESYAWLTGDLLVIRAKLKAVHPGYIRHYMRWLLQRPGLVVDGDVPMIYRPALLNQRFMKPDWSTQKEIVRRLNETESLGLGEPSLREARNGTFRCRTGLPVS